MLLKAAANGADIGARPQKLAPMRNLTVGQEVALLKDANKLRRPDRQVPI